MMNSDLRARCEAIARIEIQRRELAEEVKALKAKAKADGYDAALITKTVAVMIKPAARQKQVLEQHGLFDNYLNAVGLLRDEVEIGGETVVSMVHVNGVPVRVVSGHSVDRIDPFPPHDPVTGEITDTETRIENVAPQPAQSGTAGENDAAAVASAASPAALILEQESGVLSTGGGEPLTDETTDAVSDSSFAYRPVKSVDLADTIPETPQDDPPVASLAGEVADAGPMSASATDPECDIGNIPELLKRTPASEVRAA